MPASSPYHLPSPFTRTIVSIFGAAGAAWLRGLPALLAACERRWELTLGPPVDNLSYNYVAPATRADGSAVMLKAGVPHPELLGEMEMLRLGEGRGMVRLLDADPDWGVMLLERLRPGTPLVELQRADDEAATRVAARAMQALWRPAPTEHAFPTVARWARGLERLRAAFDGGTGPFPPRLVEAAEARFADLLASSAEPVLLHGDLHHGNILQSGDAAWVAIDPKGVIGEPAYEVGALLRNPMPDIASVPALIESDSGAAAGCFGGAAWVGAGAAGGVGHGAGGALRLVELRGRGARGRGEPTRGGNAARRGERRAGTMSRPLPPLARQTLFIEGSPVTFRRAGDAGPPLVFLHGWADSSVVWQRALAEWGDRFRVVALDQPGHGGSAPTPVAEGVAAIAARLAAAMEALGLQGATLIGHSFGGLLAMQIALSEPRLAARLVLVNPAWSRELTIPPPLRVPALGVGAMRLLHLSRLPLAWLPAAWAEPLDARWQARLRRWRALTESSPDWLLHTLRMIHEADLSARLTELQLPTLVIAGKRDRTVPPSQTRELAARLPHATLVEIEAGHQAAEDNWPAFRAALDRWTTDDRRPITDDRRPTTDDR